MQAHQHMRTVALTHSCQRYPVHRGVWLRPHEGQEWPLTALSNLVNRNGVGLAFHQCHSRAHGITRHAPWKGCIPRSGMFLQELHGLQHM